MVVDTDEFLTALVIAFRYEERRFRTEQWSAELLRGLRSLPRFEHYWQATVDHPAALGAARALLPLLLDACGNGALSFRLSSEPFVDDDRFRVVYYFPDDLKTMARFR